MFVQALVPLVLLTAISLPARAAQGLTYRQSFERGVARLAAGEEEEAAAHFRAAGELAPEAPVWKAYLALALGVDLPERTEFERDSRGPWTPGLDPLGTGDPAALFSEPLTILDLEVLPGTEACAVVASDGSLRRVELETGATAATAAEHLGAGNVGLRAVDGQCLATWAGGWYFLRDASTLAPLAPPVSLGPVESKGDAEWLAISSGGDRLALRDGAGRLVVQAVGGKTASFVVGGLAGRPERAAFSPDGSRLAVSCGARIHLLDALSGEPIAEFEVRTSRNPGPLAFHGPDRLALGWGNDELDAGVDVHRLPDGEPVAVLAASSEWITDSGGFVGDLRCDPDARQITFSVSTAGVVAAFWDGDWTERWTIDLGGDLGAILLQRAAGSERLGISGKGIPGQVVDLFTGRKLSGPAVEGHDLAETSGGRFLVSQLDGGLAVHDGANFELLYLRTEGSDGSAWLRRADSTLEVVEGAAAGGPGRYLLRGGTRFPADCWDPWLLDPLELADVPLDALPEPPCIVAAPPPVVVATESEARLAIEVAGGAPLRGIQVELAGRPAVLEPIACKDDGTTARATFRVGGPWPAEVRLRALSRAGVLSAPWRLRIEAPR